jgi:hypothetical protein
MNGLAEKNSGEGDEMDVDQEGLEEAKMLKLLGGA